MKVISEYENGNYSVTIYSDGTKVRKAPKGTILKPEFPESVDVKITNCCSVNCDFCAENSHAYGRHGIFKPDRFEGLPKIELAIGGGDPFSHPQIEDILKYLSERFVCNITVNGRSLYDKNYLENLQYFISKKYIYGVGISYSSFLPELETENSVVHCIAGIHTFEQIKECAKTNKVLILGFKRKGRGNNITETFIDSNQSHLKENLYEILGKSTLAFDNLAIEQLQLKEFVTGEAWSTLYMGKDGNFSMYYDMVKEEYRVSSNHERWSNAYMNIRNYFKRY